MSNEYLANRYGKSPDRTRRQRILWTLVGAALLLTFFVWSIAVNFIAPNNLTAQVQTYKINSSQQATVSILANHPTAKDGVCAIKVLNSEFAIVGYKELPIAADSGTNPVIQGSINTTSLGVSVDIDRCWFK
jgi:hypothetical protein